MGTAEQPQTPPRPATATTTRPTAPVKNEVLAGASDAAKSVVRDMFFERRPYAKLAFNNPYNLSLFGGGLAAAVLTANPLLFIGTLGLEALWLLYAPDSARLRHILWDPRFERLRNALEAADRAERLKGLSPDARERVEALVQRREEIRHLAAQNPSFTGDLLRNELVKTDRLVDAFVEMAMTCARYESYLGSVDADQLERDSKRYEAAAARATGPDAAQATIAQKNLAIVKKRIEKMSEIRRYLSVARGQLDLIENSFQLIADQIVTMQSPQELSGQLDELLDGVEAIRETARDTEQFLSSVDREM